jgi:acyl-CoA reductase-like NAD-dependent aldehyde dehydrogenase
MPSSKRVATCGAAGAARPYTPSLAGSSARAAARCTRTRRTPSTSAGKCLNKIPIQDLEAIFHEQLRAFLLSPEEIARHVQEADETVRAKEQTLAALETEARQVVSDMDKTHRLYLADQVPLEGFGRIYRPLEERKHQLDDELPRLQAELDVLKIRLVSQDDILSQAQDLYTRWPELTPEERRRIVEAIVDRVAVGPNEVQIALAFTPSLGSSAKREEILHASARARGLRRWLLSSTETRSKTCEAVSRRSSSPALMI